MRRFDTPGKDSNDDEFGRESIRKSQNVADCGTRQRCHPANSLTGPPAGRRGPSPPSLSCVHSRLPDTDEFAGDPMTTEHLVILLAEDDGHASLSLRNLKRAGVGNKIFRVKDGWE